MTPGFPPNNWRTGVVSFLGAAVLSFLHSRPLLHWAYGDPTAVSAEFRQSVLTVGILLAGVAAWTSSAVSAPTNAHAPAGAVRRGLPLVASHLVFLATTGAAGFSIGLAPVMWHSATTKVYGSFDPATIASGYGALLAYLAAGYLLGTLVPSYLAVPIALGLAYVLAFFTTHVFCPVFDFDVISGLEVPTRLSVVRLLFFCACFAASGLAAAAWLRMRSAAALVLPATAVIAILVPVAVIVMAAAPYTGPRVRADGAAPVCETAASSEVCVHPARAGLLPALADSVTRMSEQAGPDIFAPTRVVDATVATDEVVRAGALTIDIQGQRPEWLRAARADIAWHAAGIDACSGAGPSDAAAQDASSAVAGWLLGLSGEIATPPLPSGEAIEKTEALRRLGLEHARRLVGSVIAEIRSCTATLDPDPSE